MKKLSTILLISLLACAVAQGQSAALRYNPQTGDMTSPTTVSARAFKANHPDPTVVLTADNQVVDVTGKTLIVLDSDSTVAADRTFDITGGEEGQLLILYWYSPTNQAEITGDSTLLLNEPLIVFNDGRAEAIVLIYVDGRWVQLAHDYGREEYEVDAVTTRPGVDLFLNPDSQRVTFPSAINNNNPSFAWIGDVNTGFGVNSLGDLILSRDGGSDVYINDTVCAFNTNISGGIIGQYSMGMSTAYWKSVFAKAHYFSFSQSISLTSATKVMLTVDEGTGRIALTSNGANRPFKLTDGFADGQLVLLRFTSPNSALLLDGDSTTGGGQFYLNGNWNPSTTGETLTLLWNAATFSWYELSRTGDSPAALGYADMFQTNTKSASDIVTLTATGQTITTTGRSAIVFASDNNDFANRTFELSAGQPGQHLRLIYKMASAASYSLRNKARIMNTSTSVLTPSPIHFDEDGMVLDLIYQTLVTGGSKWVPVSAPFNHPLQAIANLDLTTAVDASGEHVFLTLDGSTGAPFFATARAIAQPGWDLLDDATPADQRSTLALGSADYVTHAKIITNMQVSNPSSVIDLTADDATVNVGLYSFVRLSSDDVTAANRTFKLSQVTETGRRLTLLWTDTDAGELIDDSAQSAAGNHRLNGNWTPTQNDTISFISNGTDWIETSRSTN